METYQKHSRTRLAASVVAIIVIAGIVLLADHFKTDSDDAIGQTTISSTSAVPPASTTHAAAPTSNNSFKDGTYAAASSYNVPSGREEIQVRLTLSSGTITDVSIMNSEGDRDSALYQQDFASSYKNQVVGQKISSLHLGIIAGASDTTDGFNEALNQIASQAQAK